MSAWNQHHGLWAWASLASIVVVDLYVRALALDVIGTAHADHRGLPVAA